MKSKTNPAEQIVKTWKTGNRVTVFFIENLPVKLWTEKVPGYKQKTIQMIGSHLHNCRRMWIRRTGKKFGIEPPEFVDRYHVSQSELIEALQVSSLKIIRILEEAIDQKKKPHGFPDITHFMTYLVAHEAHHRGQILMAARQLGYEPDDELAYGIWYWNKRAKEV